MKKIFNIIISCALSLSIIGCISVSIASAAYQNKYDLNEDGKNDVTDISLFALYLSGDSSPSNLSKYDFDNNRIISYRDYLEIRNYVNNPS